MENKTIYLVNHYGNWDGTFSSINAFATYEDAKEEYELQVKETREILFECYDEGEIVVDEDTTSCTLYLQREYDDYHEVIELMTLVLK